MVDEIRRKILKGTIAGTALLLGRSLISSSIFKESVYGINLTRRYKNERIADPRLLNILDYENINDVSINLLYFQKDIHSNEIERDINGRTVPDDSHVLDLVEKLKLKDNRITMKPLVDVPKNTFWIEERELKDLKNKNIGRGKIDSSNPNKWFKNYEEILMHYVILLKDFKVESFCIGTELNEMQKYANGWIRLIRDIKKEFNGRITYCAHWNAYEDLGFLDDLDYLSISGYFPLIEKGEEVKLEKLVDSWKIIGENLKKFKKKTGKPIVFGEIGYRSAEGAATQKDVNLEKEDYEEQRLCFRALNYAIKNKIIPVKKAYLWIDDTHNIDYFNKIGFGIFSKPAEKEILGNLK